MTDFPTIEQADDLVVVARRNDVMRHGKVEDLLHIPGGSQRLRLPQIDVAAGGDQVVDRSRKSVLGDQRRPYPALGCPDEGVEPSGLALNSELREYQFVGARLARFGVGDDAVEVPDDADSGGQLLRQWARRHGVTLREEARSTSFVSLISAIPSKQVAGLP